jgi:hypothetical protein
MGQIAQLGESSESSYLYSREEYRDEEETAVTATAEEKERSASTEKSEKDDVPDFLKDEEGVIRIE